jgi:hypothetical protein
MIPTPFFSDGSTFTASGIRLSSGLSLPRRGTRLAEHASAFLCYYIADDSLYHGMKGTYNATHVDNEAAPGYISQWGNFLARGRRDLVGLEPPLSALGKPKDLSRGLLVNSRTLAWWP